MELTNLKQIKELLSRHGFRFSKSMGQNFLVAPWVPERIAEEAAPDEKTGVLEIGPGIGCLTERLSKTAGKVLAVELDRSLKPVLEETLADCGNVEIVFGDILKQDIKELVAEHFEGLRPIVCANLPYNITSPVLAALLESRVFDSVTVMVQREAARRISSKPGGSDYGAFTVFCGWLSQPELLFDVPPNCFVPPPKVYSSVIRMTRRECPPAEVRDEKFFFRVVRAAFGQRRKTLANALAAGLGGIPKADIEAAIASLGLDKNIRGERLGIGEFAVLSNLLYR